MKNYYDFQAGEKNYRLRLNTRNIIALERVLGCNPVSIFGDGNTVPTITQMVAVLHASLQQLNHGISMEDAYDIFDDYIADGHTSTDFIGVIVDIYKFSGIIKNTKTTDEVGE
ncbi:MAG: hypothetical protein KBT27_02170 [Prevotellaceae bacterium]|nr:hypothetical protein [Candidatus Faecinaster equi]